MVISDQSSRNTWARKLTVTKTKHVIKCLNEYTRNYGGITFVINLDNDPQYRDSNKAISQWCLDYRIWHERSADLNPKGNGEAEEGVIKAKKTITHTILARQDP